jgi:hypothetical protein
MQRCNECKQCNRKGKPSVTRESSYCYSHRTQKDILRLSIFSRIKERIQNSFLDEFGNIKKLRGFRKSWIK